jgi:hypothetical protein
LARARGLDDEFRLQFAAVGSFDADKKKIFKAALDSLISNAKPAAGLRASSSLNGH